MTRVRDAAAPAAAGWTVRSASRGVRAAALALLAGCVTVVSDEPAVDAIPLAAAMPVTVPLRGAAAVGTDAAALDAYYGSVVAQLQDAVLERDPELLASLLAVHDRPVAPDWAAEQMAWFRRLVRVLAFEQHAAATAGVGVVGATPAIGAIVPVVVRVPGESVRGLVVPGRDRGDLAARVLVEVAVADHDCYGGTKRREFSELLPLERSVRVGDGEPLELAFAIPELAPEGCRRVVDVTCTLLPGTVLLDGERAPNQSVPLSGTRFELYPLGVETVWENPYTNLRNGLELGDPKHFDNVFLAARAMPDALREAALEKLVHHLRIGRPDVARVCAAALREMTGLSLSLDDRDAWLRWWQERADAGRPR